MSAATSALDPLVDQELPTAGAGVARHARHLSLASNEFGIGWVAAGLGVLLQGIAIAVAQTNFDGGLNLYWISHGIPFLVFAALLLDASLTSLQRATIVALVGLVPTLYSRMAGIVFFSGFDEMLHARTLNDLLSGSGLFAPNSQLEISPFYPGLEMVAGTLIQLTGLPVAWAAMLVVLACRALLVLVLYQAALGLTKNPRIASLVVLFYACGPQFYLFNSQFSYQTLALTLGAGGLMLLRRAQTATNLDSQRRLRNAAVLCLGAMEVSHHLTSWVMLGFLWLWAIVSKRKRGMMVKAALTATGLMIAWTAAIAVRLTGYLGPVFLAAFTEFSNMLSGGGGSNRKLFSDSGGDVVPTWQRGVLLAYAVICGLSALIAGFILLRNAIRRRDRAIAILGLLTLAYPVTFAGRLAPSAAEVGDRASTFLFLPLALSLAGLLGVRGVAPDRAGRRRRTGLVAAVMAVSGVAYIGGVALGAGPDWARLPGPYLPSSDRRSADPENLAAIRWVGEHLAPGSRIVADRFNAVALEGYTRVYPVVAQETNPDNKNEPWSPSYLYFSQTWGTEQIRTVEGLRLRYVYVDTRIADNPPHVGFYFTPGEYATSAPLPLTKEFKDKHPIWLTKAQLTKFDTAKGLTAIYRHGPIVIYDTKGAWGKTDAKGKPIVEHFSGWTGTPRHLPPLVDLVLGFVIGAGLFAARRSVVAFVTSIVDDAGGTGLGVTVLASMVILGFLVLGTGMLPGPLVTMGALLAVAVLIFVGLARGRLDAPRLLTRWQLQPLVVAGVVLGAAGLFVAYKSLWTAQVYDATQILLSLSSGGPS